MVPKLKPIEIIKLVNELELLYDQRAGLLTIWLLDDDVSPVRC